MDLKHLVQFVVCDECLWEEAEVCSHSAVLETNELAIATPRYDARHRDWWALEGRNRRIDNAKRRRRRRVAPPWRRR